MIRAKKVKEIITNLTASHEKNIVRAQLKNIDNF